ncbi:MAG: hypothetical protein IT305_21605 [Chloroflexi bacterium]|nr:hypothetical protein [Chloroflexota bacterium]
MLRFQVETTLEGLVDGIAHNQSEGSGPRFGARPTFGMARDQSRRIEIAFALKQGGMLTVVEELDDAVSEEVITQFGEQLAQDVAKGAPRTFSDGWHNSGQRAWVNLGDVVAFSLRPAR